VFGAVIRIAHTSTQGAPKHTRLRAHLLIVSTIKPWHAGTLCPARPSRPPISQHEQSTNRAPNTYCHGPSNAFQIDHPAEIRNILFSEGQPGPNKEADRPAP